MNIFHSSRISAPRPIISTLILLMLSFSVHSSLFRVLFSPLNVALWCHLEAIFFNVGFINPIFYSTLCCCQRYLSLAPAIISSITGIVTSNEYKVFSLIHFTSSVYAMLDVMGCWKKLWSFTCIHACLQFVVYDRWSRRWLLTIVCPPYCKLIYRHGNLSHGYWQVFFGTLQKNRWE